MTHPKILEKIDWTDLRSQKASLMTTIDYLEKNKIPFIPEHLTGILHLIDALQDYAVDEMGVSEIHVFDFELEEERENPDPDKTKTVFLCSNCGSDNVEMKAWVNPNKEELAELADVVSFEGEDAYCNDCKGHHELLSHELKVNAKVIGYQVVGVDDTDREGEIHPDMDASFCLYNLSWCKERLHEYYNWRLLTIWEGDVEEPTFMFEGDPRDEDFGTTDGHIDPTNR